MNVTSTFDDFLIPTATLLLEGHDGKYKEVEMLFDTGFNMAISLTEETVADLGLDPFDDTITKKVKTAQGEASFPVCLVAVVKEGVRVNYEAIISSMDALGNEFFRGCTITFTVEPGANIQIVSQRS